MNLTAATVALVVALLTSTVGPVLVIIVTHRLRSENSSQHAEGRALIERAIAGTQRTEQAIRDVGVKVDGHGEHIAVLDHRVTEMEKHL